MWIAISNIIGRLFLGFKVRGLYIAKILFRNLKLIPVNKMFNLFVIKNLLLQF